MISGNSKQTAGMIVYITIPSLHMYVHFYGVHNIETMLMLVLPPRRDNKNITYLGTQLTAVPTNCNWVPNKNYFLDIRRASGEE